jgi:aminoglycoside phosphotransferase family enzyme/predicted kinase
MELTELIAGLSHAGAYPFPVAAVEVRQTHISVVFLAGPFAYKIKKPVDLGFLDFSTLKKRRYFCEEEVRLNRRLAPKIYQGVVPVTREGKVVRLGGDGEIVEWAVQMTRLPDSATVLERLKGGGVGVPFVEELARRIARFHAVAETDARIAAFGRSAVVAANARENFDQSANQVGAAVSAAVFTRLRALTEAELRRLAPLIDARARRGVPRDAHGDLHLDHVYSFPDQEPPADLVIVDCIEFNERFRYSDPVADMAFLVMDLIFHGRRDLALAFADAYFREADDEEGRALLAFYVAYRAVVRAKVEGLELGEAEIDEPERRAALVRARGHWLLALGELESPRLKPSLVLVGGLPGTGKSTLARSLAGRANFAVIRSDVVRKELAGVLQSDRVSADFQEGFYSAEWTERTYAECLRRVEAALFEGRRVLVDATFREERMRGSFLDAAARWAVPGLLLVCQAPPEVVRARLESRRADASDADWAVYLRAAERWEAPGPFTHDALRLILAGGDPDQTLPAAEEILHREGLI